jgi:hypothetical protein
VPGNGHLFLFEAGFTQATPFVTPQFSGMRVVSSAFSTRASLSQATATVSIHA